MMYGLFKRVKKQIERYNKTIRNKEFEKQEKIVNKLKPMLEKLRKETNTNLYILQTNELLRI